MTELFLFEPAPRGKEEKNKLGKKAVEPFHLHTREYDLSKNFKISRHIESLVTCIEH